jgi:RNA polymerase sigma factor (sigma-70 family)
VPPKLTARTEKILNNLGLAYSRARLWHSFGVGDLDDLRQVAAEGLIGAVDRFDSSRDVAFSTYAVETIDGVIKKYIFGVGGRSVVRRRRTWSASPADSVTDDDWHLAVAAPTADRPDVIAERSELVAIVRAAVDSLAEELTDRQRAVLRRIVGDDPRTQAEVGDDLNITRQAVQQIEAGLIRRLEKRLRRGPRGQTQPLEDRCPQSLSPISPSSPPTSPARSLG